MSRPVSLYPTAVFLHDRDHGNVDEVQRIPLDVLIAQGVKA